MIIKFTNFSDGIHNLSFKEPVGKLNLSSEFIDNVLLRVELDKSPSQLVLSCDVDATARRICDRCTKEYDATINHQFKMTYLIGEERAPEEEQTDLRYLSADQNKIDLTEDVTELTELALPMKSLCSENCKGLCPKCGKDLNEGKCDCKDDEIDPAWEPLLKLKDKLNN